MAAAHSGPHGAEPRLCFTSRAVLYAAGNLLWTETGVSRQSLLWSILGFIAKPFRSLSQGPSARAITQGIWTVAQ